MSGTAGNYTFEGEVTRRLDDVTSRLEALALRMESTYVRFDLFEASKQLSETERLQMSQRLDKLESRSEWLLRTVGGIIIAAVLGMVIAAARVKTGV